MRTTTAPDFDLGDTVTIEPIAPGHADFVHALYAESAVRSTLLRLKRPLSRAEAGRMCEAAAARTGVHRFVGIVRRDPVGLGQVRDRPDGAPYARIGYSILPRAWGRGFATELVALLVRLARDQLGVREARASTLVENPASGRVLARNDFGRGALEFETDADGASRQVLRWHLACALLVASMFVVACSRAEQPGTAAITAAELAARLATDGAPLVLDVRTSTEYEAGHIPGAINVPHDELPARMDELAIEPGDEVVVHCQSGKRAELAEGVLRDAGYTNVRELEGHWRAWREAGLLAE